MTEKFHISRTFNAPRETVWQAWTQNDKLKQWFGPKTCPIISCKLDLRVGGKFIYGMRTPDGGEMWGRWIFEKITKPEQLVFMVSFSEATGEKITRHPWHEQWPLEMFSTINFIEHGNKTEVSVEWQAHNASDIERKTFAEGMDSMKQGWSGTFEGLEKYLAEV